jgi:hypothetical protein
MAILDNELMDDNRLPLDPTLGGPVVPMGSPDLLNVDYVTSGGPITAPVSPKGLTLEQLSEVANMPGPGGFAEPFGYIPQSELIANQRYPVYGREVGDLEDINAQDQTALGNLGRGLIKFAGRTTGSFAEGMFTIPNLISSVKSGDKSKLSGDPNGIEGTIDGWMESMDNFIPTYQSAYAKAHPFRGIIPFTEGSSYFWGEKFLPNLGFMAGSFASAAVQDVVVGAATGAIGELPLVASQLGKASLYLNKLFSAESVVGRAVGATKLSQLTRLRQLGEELGKSPSQMVALEKLAQMSAAVSLGNKARYGMAVLGSAMNEAGMEGRNGYKMIKEELINQYKFDHFGQEPDAVAMEDIESRSTAGMNTRFGINMALLTASNGLFFGNAFKSIIAGGGPVTGGLQKSLEEFGKIGLKEGSLDVFEKKVAGSIAAKAWDVVKPKIGTMFTEGVFEEGGQFAAERGTYDYYTREYKSGKNKDSRDELNDIISSTVYGLNQQFGTQEGIENMVIGSLTGLLVGGGQSLYDNYKKQGVDARLGKAINVLNTQGVTNTIKQMYDSTQTSAVIAKEMQEANASGDVFKYKNLQDKQFFTFVQSRIPSGMHDVTIEQLRMLKDLPKDQFESMFQLDFNSTNKQTVGEYVDNLINKANEIKETSDLINKTFINPFKNAPNFDDVNTLIEAGNYNTFEDYKTDLTYNAVTSKNIDNRLNSIQTSVSDIHPLISNGMLSQLTSKEGLTELRDFYEQKAASLSETIDLYTNAAERKTARDQVKALRTNAEKINLLLKDNKVDDKTFEKLLNFELNGQDATRGDVVPLGSANDLRNYGVDINRLNERKQKASKAYDELTTREGFEKYFEQADEIAKEKAAEVEEEEVAKPEETEQPVVETAYDFVNKGGEKEAVQEGREYEIGKSKLAKLSKIADDRWQVTSPDGTITSFKSEEAAKAALEDANSDLADLTKVKVIGLNENGTVKVEDVNGDIKNIAPDQLSGYEKIQTDQEKLQKFADDVNKEQAEIELNSGDVAIVDTPITKSEDEGRLVDANILFTRTTSEREEDLSSFKPHQLRTIEFLNNVGKFDNRSKLRVILVTPNQEDTLGLTGLTEMQYSKPKDEVADATDIDLGFVAAVYVEQDGTNVYFVDKDGKRVAKVGEKMDMSKVVYGSMPTTELRYKSDKSPKYRAEQKELAEAKAIGWKTVRAELFEEPGYRIYNFTVSKGIPELTKGERNHIVGTLVPETVISTQEGLIQVSNTGFIFHNGKQVKVSIGHPYIQYGDTLQNVRSRNFSPKEAKGVFEVLKKISEEVNGQLAAGKPIKINRLYSTYLQNVLYWKSKGASSNNQIFINTNTMNLELGKEKYDLTKIAESEDQIVKQLQSVYQNLNRDTLTKKFHEKFLEPHIGPDGNLIVSEWDNYQTYLLADKFPNGSSRPVSETPLSTNVAKITDAVPYNFKQKYAVLQGMELPEQVVTPEAKAAKEELNKWDLEGNKENVFDGVSTGPVLFTATKDAKGDLFIKITDNQTVTDIANNEAKVQQIVDYLKQAERFDATKDDLGIVKDYLKIQIANEVKKREQAAPTSRAATVTQTDLASGKVTGTVTTSTESRDKYNKRVDIELRREQKIDKLNKEQGFISQSDQKERIIIEEEYLAELAALEALEAPVVITPMDIIEEKKADIKKRRDAELLLSLSKPTTAKQVNPNTDLATYERLIIDGISYQWDKASQKYLRVERSNVANLSVGAIDKSLSEGIGLDQLENKDLKIDLYSAHYLAASAGKKDVVAYASTFKNKVADVFKPINAKYDAELAVLKTGEPTNIEAKKADIERRKQEELKFTFGTNVEVISSGKLAVIERNVYFTPKYPKGANRISNRQDAEKLVNEYKEINDKYNAELAALEGGKPAEAKPSDVDFSKSKPPKGSQYRRVGVGKAEKMTDAEIQLFKEWANKVVPNVPFEILDRIITTHDGEKAWGIFENGVAKFYKGGQRGTEYHEIGEGIWNVFLSPEEQQSLLDEFKAKTGKFKDRESGKMLFYEEATDEQAKERILDDFADFRLGKLPARNIGEAILKFFRDIINFVKSFVNKPSLKEQLFKAIDTGKYKNYTVSESAKSLDPQYSRVPGLSEKDTNDVVRDMTARFFAKVFGTNKSLYEISNLTAPELFDAIKAEYEEEDKIIGERSWNALVNKTKDFLRTFKIEFDEDNTLDINAENITNRMYAAEAFTTDWKKNSPFPVKLVVGTLPETVPTNQVDSSTLSMPKVATTEKYFLKLVNFSRAFATVIDKLANTTKVTKMIDKLVDLSRYDSNYVRLFERLGGTVGESGEMVTIDFSKFEPHDWRLFVQFYQTFTKQRPNALVQYVSGDEVYTSPADQFTVNKQTKAGWMNNLKDLSADPNSFVRYNKGQGTYKVVSTKGVEIESPQQMIDFLNKIGVTYTMDTYLRLKPEQRKDFNNAVASIHAYFGKTAEIATVSGKTLGIDGPLDTLANLYVKVENPIQDTTYSNVEGEKSQAYTQNNAPSLFANEFNEAETVAELKTTRPELNDVFSTNSLFFKSGGLFYNKDGNRIKTLMVSHIGGTKNQNTGVDKSTVNLTFGNRLTQEINQNLEGNYHILIPADSSTEWMMNLGNNISFKEVAGGLAFAKVHTIFQGYLKDEIALALDFANREKLANVTDNFKNLGKAKELRFFKDILKGTTLSGVNNLIINGATQDQIDEYFKNKKNLEAINTDVEAFIKRNVAATKKLLEEHYKLTKNSNNTVKYEDLDGKFAKAEQLNKNKLSQDDVTDILTFARINYIINNIELHKILFGDPYQFAIKKGILDETKRVKSFLSGRNTTFDSPEYNTFHNQRYNNAGEVQLTANDPGHHLFKPYMNTVTLRDVTVRDGINEADAGSWIMDHAYRSVKLRNGQWDLDSVAEDNYQWNMAYTRRAFDKRKDIEWTYGDNEALKAHDDALLATPEPEFIREVLKPIVSGPKHDSNRIDLVLDKTSQMPLYYKDVEKYNLGDFYVKMWREKGDYAIFESGRKLGTEELFDLYDPATGEVNTAPFGKMIPVGWKTYGIQVENSYDGGSGQTLGSQPTKIASLDLYENGKPRTTNPERAEIIEKAYTRNVKALNNLFLENYNQLLKRLGVEDLGGIYNIVDPTAASKALEYEMLRRELDDNAIETIRLDANKEFPIPFESSTAYIQIRDILYSMVDKAIGSPKVNGFPAVQVPVTMWEKSGEKRGVVEINGKQVFTDGTLKSYTKENRYMEILLPYWFKEQFKKAGFKSEEELLDYLNRPENESILKGVGFRIPNQAASSSLVFKVKGFLPQSMGKTVVLPSEITEIAGSDFDIDKLNMYLKNTYINSKGQLKQVPFFGYGEQGKEAIKKFILKEDLESIFDIDERIINSVDDDYDSVADKLYKQSVENEYYESLQDMLILDENYDRLITPISDAGLKDIASELDGLRGVDETKIENRMLDGNFLTMLRHAFVIAKKWVGIGAVNITNHSLFQKIEGYIDPMKFSELSDYEKKIIGDGKVVLPHNTVRINGQDRISLSGVLDRAGKYISDNLSGFITAFVDVAKDPYILKILGSNNVISTAMFLTRIGTPVKTTALFLNQPIIKEYMTYLDSIGSTSIYSKKNLDVIRKKFPADRTAVRGKKIDMKNLVPNIKNYYSNKPIDNSEQQKILVEFLKYHKMGQFLFKFTQATNYDTTKMRSAEAMSKKRMRTATAKETNIISSVQNVLDRSFVGEKANILENSINAISPILKLDQVQYSVITNQVLDPYKENEYLGADDFDRVAVKIKSSFLDYVFQTKTDLSDNLQKLLVDPYTAVVSEVGKARKDYPDMEILQQLEQASTDRVGGAKSLKLKANLKTAYDNNLYQGMMRELRDNPATNNLYNRIVDLAILQGTYQSAISIKNIVPIEDYSERVKNAINSLASDLNLENFVKVGAFARNNWNDDAVFKKITDIAPSFQGEGINDLGEYISEVEFNEFPSLEGLSQKGIKSILVLDRFDNFTDVGSDYILVPRVVRNGNERIDVITGGTVTRVDYERRKAIGDTSLNDVMGFQKVKYKDGRDFVRGANYYYKAINLWGDGQYATEMYNDIRKSVFKNGTIPVETEIADEDIIDYFDKKLEAVKENVVSLPAVVANPNKEFVMDNDTYYVTPDGTVNDKNNKPVKDKVVINQINARQQIQNGTIKTINYNGADYFVLNDGTIIDATKDNFGKEPSFTDAAKEVILARAIIYKKTC